MCKRLFSWRAIGAIALLFAGGLKPSWAQNATSQQNAPQNGQQAGKEGDSNPAPRRSTVELIREDQLVGLPLNGRSYSSLATLQAGVSDASNIAGPRGVGGGNLNVSGARSSANTYLMDGTNIQNSGNGSPRSAAGVQLGSDATFQVQVSATTQSAEYGRGSGGVLNSITRSGGEKFHGTLFEFFRNSKLDARNFFDAGKAPFKRNQFGGMLTGPLVKGKTYFMGNYEAMRDRLTETDVSFAPDAEARQGIITDANGVEIRRVTVDPQVAPYLALYTAPNGARRGNGIAETIGAGFQPVNENFFVVRVDHQITQRDSGFLRYSFDDATSVTRGSLFAFRSLTKTRQQYLTLVASHIFSPSTVNSVRIGYTRPVSSSQDDSIDVTIPTERNFVPGALQFGLIQVAGLTDFGPSSSQPSRAFTNTFQFANDLVLQRGGHALKLGGEIHRYRWDAFTSDAKWAVWSFDSLESFIQAGPTETTNLTVALPGSVSDTAYRQTLAALYVQDSYRVNPRLDLNLGLRYEVTTKINDNRGRSSYLADPMHDTEAQTGELMKDNPSLNNFSPRIGFNWAPWAHRDTVVNAGVGTFRDQILYYLVDPVKNAVPFYNVAVLTNFRAQGIFPKADLAAAGKPLGTKTLDYAHIKLPVVYRYNLTVQHPLPAGFSLRAAYVGARGNHLMRGYETNLFAYPVPQADGSLLFPSYALPGPDNRINRNFGSVEIYQTDAQSFYNSLQLTLNKSASRGMSMTLSYTYSKSVDDATKIGLGDVEFGWDRKLDRALSDFDLRHRLTMNYFLTSPRQVGPPALSRILGRWRLGGIFGYRTGSPSTIRLGVRTAGNLFTSLRPNLAAGFSNSPTTGVSDGCPGGAAAGIKLGGPDRYFDPCAFTAPAPGTIGNLGRNTLINASAIQTDISLQREFVLGGEKRFQFRMEMFNLPNHPSFGSPPTGSQSVFTGSGQRSSRVGRITRMAVTPRQLQFALRLSF